MLNTFIQVTLFRYVDGKWSTVAKSVTNTDGRSTDFITREKYSTGIYKFQFEVGKYYAATNTETLYPFVEVVFSYSKIYI